MFVSLLELSLAAGKFDEFSKSSMIHQTKTIQISN